MAKQLLSGIDLADVIISKKNNSKQSNFLIVCLLFFVMFKPGFAQAEISKHHQIMAGLLLHLTSFTQWPDMKEETVNLCIVGDDPFKQYINSMVKRRSTNRSGQAIVILRASNYTTATIRACHMVYINSNQMLHLWEILPTDHHILLVGEDENFIDQGGMVNFVRDNTKVKLEVNLTAVLNAKLKLSSTLLKHAKIITDAPSRSAFEENNNESK